VQIRVCKKEMLSVNSTDAGIKKMDPSANSADAGM